MAHVPSNGFPEPKPANSRCRHLTRENRCGIFASLERRGYSVCRAYDCFGTGPLVSAWIKADGPGPPRTRRLEEFRALSRLRLLAKAALEQSGGKAGAREVFERLEAISARYQRDADLSVDGETRDVLRGNEEWITEILSRLAQ